MKYLLLLLLVGCAHEPLTVEEEALKVEEKENRAYEENDRRAMYLMWEQRCKDAGKIIFAYKPTRPCLGRRNCIPNKWDWDYNIEKDRPDFGNAYTCVTREQAMQRINF